MTAPDTILVRLSAPTVFADLNQAENREPDYARDELHVKRLKFKLFREMSTLPPDSQILFAIQQLVGLSESDTDELYTEDAAAITKVILGFMKAFLDITKDLLSLDKS